MLGPNKYTGSETHVNPKSNTFHEIPTTFASKFAPYFIGRKSILQNCYFFFVKCMIEVVNQPLIMTSIAKPHRILLIKL